MAFHSESVNLLSKLACALGHGGREGGLGFPLCPSPQTEKWKQVSVWERSSDVTGYTASSSNPAGTFSPQILSLDKHGANCCGIKREHSSSASSIQSD